jgi:hypothetical protein
MKDYKVDTKADTAYMESMDYKVASTNAVKSKCMLFMDGKVDTD